MKRKFTPYLIVFLMLGMFFGNLSAQNPTETKFNIYPSEVKDLQFYIASDQQLNIQEVDIKIINLIGTEVSYTVEKMVDGKLKIELQSRIPTGIYIVRINKDNKQSTHRIMVRTN